MVKNKNKKKKKWLKFRHKIVRNIAYAILYPYSKIRYGVTVEKFREQENRPYLVLLNHQTPFDQFFVGMAFRGPIYYLASEDIFSKGWVSSAIRYLVAPIPIKKQTTDVQAILDCMRVAREGGTICIAPEGNRTYSGRTEYMSPSIAMLAKKLRNPIVLYRLEGGYGAHPRWSDVVRKGKMRGYVSKVIMPEEYAKMSDDELFEVIKDGLFVDEAIADARFESKHLAEYLERCIYICPECGFAHHKSEGDELRCLKCGRTVRYLPTKEFEGVGCESKFRFVADWYDWQKDFVNSTDVTSLVNEPIFTDTSSILEVVPYKKKMPIADNVTFRLFGNRIEATGSGFSQVFNFDEVTAVTVLGRNKANIYFKGKIYQLKGDVSFNALKYVHIFNRYKNITKGEEHEQFLGL